MTEESMIAKRPLLMAILALCYGLVAASPVSAQTYPQRPVKIVVPFLLGGGTDLVARTIADKMSAKLKQTFIVENRPAAGGNAVGDAVDKPSRDGPPLH